MTKATGRHPHKALTAVRVRSLKESGRYADGNGLYLVVAPSGAKRWLLRTVVHGRRRDIGLGSQKLVSLADARDMAFEYRKLARSGGDPLAERRKARSIVPSFENAARTVHAEHSLGWKNSKHAAQWIQTLEQYVFPIFGARRVDQVGTPEVLNALSQIWLTKPETARRVRQRIGTVLDWAKAAGHRTGDNPIEGISKGLPKQPKQDKHHAAIPYRELPGFVEEVRGSDANESTRLALEFLILTATRTSEVLRANWAEVDTERQTWTIPAKRMKVGRDFRVPLSPSCMRIMSRAREISDAGRYIFPGRSKTQSLSNMAFLMTIRRMGYAFTTHGFRSTFRDWAAERTNFSREVCEMALSHAVRDKVEAAYLRGDIFEKRRELMRMWATFVTSARPANIVSLRA